MPFYDSRDFVPDCSIGYLVRRSHQMGSALLEPVFAQEGLTMMQWSALIAIRFAPGATAADLARDLGHDKGAMTRLVDTIEERGWVTRERTQQDRRCINLRLTPEGEAVGQRCKLRVVECWNAWLADWSHDDAATLIALLQKLRGTLAAVEGPCA